MKKNLDINGIPAVFWGKPDKRLIIAVHGDMSNKEDTIIELLANVAIPKGYAVLSFDLPEHGDRKKEPYPLHPSNAISDLLVIYDYATSLSDDISLFACSIGAYFSMIAYAQYTFEKVLFLSPVIDMEKIIHSMMSAFHISEQQLRKETQIPLPINKTLDWEYYSFVKEHPVNPLWKVSIIILYGDQDNLTSNADMEQFAAAHKTNLTVVEDAEHFFNATEELRHFVIWLNQYL